MAEHLTSVIFLYMSLFGLVAVALQSSEHRFVLSEETRKIALIAFLLVAIYKAIHVNVMLIYHLINIPHKEVMFSAYFSTSVLVVSIVLYVMTIVDDRILGVKPYFKNGVMVAKYALATMTLQTLFIYSSVSG